MHRWFRSRLPRLLLLLALCAGGASQAWAQSRNQVPIPGVPLNPTSRAECDAMSREWQELASQYGQMHEFRIINGGQSDPPSLNVRQPLDDALSPEAPRTN
jgi:hypothetical protein